VNLPGIVAGGTTTTNVWGVFTFSYRGEEVAFYLECYTLTTGNSTLEINAFIPLGQYNN